MTIGVLVLLIVCQSYGLWVKQFQHFEKLWHAASIERVLIQFLHRDCLHAGYIGKHSRDRHFPVRSAFLDPRSVHQIVYGVRNSMAKRMISQEMSSRLLPFGETMFLFHVPLSVGTLTQDQQRASDPLRVAGAQGEDNALAIVSDDKLADRFIVTGTAQDYWMHQKPLSKPYHKGATVGIVQPIAYYLAKPTQPSRQSRGYALYRDNLRGHAEELIDGLKTLEMDYGWLNNDTVVFKRSSEMLDPEWLFVETIRITIRNIYDQVKTTQCILANRRHSRFSAHRPNQ